MSFKNIYYQRTAGTPRSCVVCLRPTTVVLATSNDVDFLYTCERHLSDSGFATRIVDEPKVRAENEIDEETIKKIREEWEEKQKRKKDKEKEKGGKDKEDPEGDKQKDKQKTADSKEKASEPLPTCPPTRTHPKYSLHRQVFATRLVQHRKRRQAKEAKEIAPRLPGVPGGPPRI